MPDTKTRAQLVEEAAKSLMIPGAGQPLDAGYAAEIDGKVDALFAQLSGDDIVTIDSEDEIPPAVFNPLAELLANVCAAKFGKAYSEDAKRVFEAQIRKTMSSRPTYEVQKATYY